MVRGGVLSTVADGPGCLAIEYRKQNPLKELDSSAPRGFPPSVTQDEGGLDCTSAWLWTEPSTKPCGRSTSFLPRRSAGGGAVAAGSSTTPTTSGSPAAAPLRSILGRGNG